MDTKNHSKGIITLKHLEPVKVLTIFQLELVTSKTA